MNVLMWCNAHAQMQAKQLGCYANGDSMVQDIGGIDDSIWGRVDRGDMAEVSLDITMTKQGSASVLPTPSSTEETVRMEVSR
jgi:hypothetical protein